MADINTPSKCFLDLINTVDNVPFDFVFGSLYQLLLPNDTRPHGFMLPSTVAEMPWSSEFAINDEARTVQLRDSSEGKDTAAACNAAFGQTIDVAIERKLFFSILAGQHSEMYRIIGANQFTYLERWSAPIFGIATRGAHMTAYVQTPAGLKIWVPRRSAHLFAYPNMLDTTVAGGTKADHLPFDCILAEADEEASLPADFVKQNARAVGVITYMSQKGENGLIHPDVLYVYDIELPESMAPKPQDDEVAEFYLWGVEEIKQAMLRREFKPNCSLVMLDFFVRHGIITQENEPDYLEIVARLRRRLPVPTRAER